jgi:sugar/nucleoside kinase (ribokinase family)
VAERLVVTPGGMAAICRALGRLGVSAVVCGPIGRDPAGRLLAELLAEAGIRRIGGETSATTVTVSLPVDGDRAFVSVIPPSAIESDIVAGLAPRAVVVDLPEVAAIAPGPRIYAVVGEPEVRQLIGDDVTALSGADSLSGIAALFTNEREALALTGAPDPESAAARLASWGTVAVVTLGERGALLAEPGGAVLHEPAPHVSIDDTTGAGDLFAAAWIWADLLGRSLDERLAVAVSYAAHSLAARADGPRGLARGTFAEILAESLQETLAWVGGV